MFSKYDMLISKTDGSTWFINHLMHGMLFLVDGNGENGQWLRIERVNREYV